MTNERLGHAILQLGLLPREIVSAAFRRVGPDGDLCAFLIGHGRLTEADAQRARALAAGAGDAPSIAADQVATLRRPTSQGPAPVAPGSPAGAASGSRSSAASSDGELTVLGGSVELARAASHASSDGELTVLGASVEVERTVLGVSSSDGQSTMLGADGKALLAAESQDDVELTRRASSDHLIKAASGAHAAPPLSASSASALSLSSPSGILDLLPGFEIERELGRGGMGMVVLAKKGGRRHVIKLMTALEPSLEELERFKREARAVESLVHPNIIRLLEFGEVHGVPYFSMEYLKGQDLKELVIERIKATGEPPSLDWVVETIHAVACGLAHAHDAGIVHRDLKPANILIEEKSKRPIIIDFGLAKGVVSEDYADGDALTRTGEALGTPAYMAPEQMDAGQTKTVEPKNDVWGLAATLFYALTGQAPYTGATAINIYKQLMTGPPKPIREVNPAVPVWLGDLCEVCFQPELEDRATLDDVIQALETRSSDQLDLEAARRRKSQRQAKRLRMTFAAVAVMLATFAVAVMAITERGPFARPLSLTFGPLPDVVTDSKPLVGRVSGTAKAKVSLRIGAREQAVAVDENGRFRINLGGLSDGEVPLRLVARSARDEVQTFERRVRIDRRKPSFESVEQSFDGEVLTIRGGLSEDGCEVRLGDQKASVSGRHFTLILKEPPSSDELLVVDPTGKSATPGRKSVWLFRPSGGTDDEIEARAKELTNAIQSARAGDIFLFLPGRYRKTRIFIREPVTLLGVRPGRPLSSTIEFKTEAEAFNPEESDWPIFESEPDGQTALVTVRLARSEGPNHSDRPKVTIRHVVLRHPQRGWVKNQIITRKELSNQSINDYREVVKKRYQDAIKMGRLSIEQSERAVLGEPVDLEGLTDKELTFLVTAYREREETKSKKQTVAQLFPRDLSLEHLKARSVETPLRIEQGAVRLESCVVDADGYYTVLSGPPLDGGRPNLLEARSCWFHRAGVQGVTIVGGKVTLDQCHFTEKLKKSVTSWRYSKWPFVMNDLGQLVIYNRAEAVVRGCEFHEARDTGLVAGQSAGWFGAKVRGKLWVENCRFFRHQDEAIDLGVCCEATIRGCRIVESRQEGLYARPGLFKVTVEDTTFVRCGRGRYKIYTNMETELTDEAKEEERRENERKASATPVIHVKNGGDFVFRRVTLEDSHRVAMQTTNANIRAEQCVIKGGVFGVVAMGKGLIQLEGCRVTGQAAYPLAGLNFEGELRSNAGEIQWPDKPSFKPLHDAEELLKPIGKP